MTISNVTVLIELVTVTIGSVIVSVGFVVVTISSVTVPIGSVMLAIGIVMLTTGSVSVSVVTIIVAIGSVTETIVAKAVFIVENQGGKRLFWRAFNCPAMTCAGVTVLARLKAPVAGTIKWTDNQRAPGVLDLQPLVNRVQREAKVASSR